MSFGMTRNSKTGKGLKTLKRKLNNLQESSSGDSSHSSNDPEAMNVRENFKVGSIHIVYHREKFPCLAEIIEVKSEEDQEKYYVHYCKYDKRLDEWISEDRFLSKEAADEYVKENSPSKSLEQSASQTSFGGGSTERTLTRTLRRKFEESHQGGRRPFEDPIVEQLEQEHEAATKVKNIQKIEIGRYEIDCWYFSPYPDAYSKADKLFICEHCLKYMRFVRTLLDHQKQCKLHCPPGKQIYKKGNLAVYELDGEVEKLFCQNLCLIAKLFLDHKTLYYDVSPFFFYVLCEVDDEGIHPVGYFSKEKNSPDDYNLACIMILPPHQRKGYGRFLIQLSYEITKREGKTGSPEKPLSDLGLVSYRSFWTYELLQKLKSAKSGIILSIGDLVEMTAFKRDDIIDTLARLSLITMWRGEPALNYSAKAADEHLKAFVGKKFTTCDPKYLKWTK